MTRAAVVGRGAAPGERLVRVLAERHGVEAVPASDRADVLVCPPGTPRTARRAALADATRRGVGYVDASWDPAWIGEVVAARSAAAPIVVGGALSPAMGLALAEVAAAGRTRVTDVHICYAFPDPGGVRALVAGDDPAAALGAPLRALVAGAPHEEWPAETRRLAWFPRPLGPRHAICAPGAEPTLASSVLPSALTVRTYLAMPGWRAEAAQALARLAARDRVRSWLARRLDRPVPVEAPRWACVVEVAGPDGVVRAWANGRDPRGVAVAVTAAATHAAAGGGGPPACGDEVGVAGGGAGGAPVVVAPPALVGAEPLLDHLAATVGLRWSVIRPDPADDAARRPESLR